MLNFMSIKMISSVRKILKLNTYIHKKKFTVNTHIATRSKITQVITFEAGLLSGVAGNFSMLTANCLRGSTSGFLFGFTSQTASQRMFKIKVFLPLNGVPVWASGIHLLGVACYEAPVVRIRLIR